MIIRIQGEGQYHFDDDSLKKIQELDNTLGDSLNESPESFRVALNALEGAVREHGTRLADDELKPSDVVLPPSDVTLDEVKAILNENDGEGLIPG